MCWMKLMLECGKPTVVADGVVLTVRQQMFLSVITYDIIFFVNSNSQELNNITDKTGLTIVIFNCYKPFQHVGCACALSRVTRYLESCH